MTLAEKRFNAALNLVVNLITASIYERSEILFSGIEIESNQIKSNYEDRELWVQLGTSRHMIFDNSSEYVSVKEYEDNFRDMFKIYKMISY
jgi:hypothetical protein